MESDVIIIGSGMSGSEVATELLRHGVDCLLLESGGASAICHVREDEDPKWLSSESDPHFVPFFDPGDDSDYPSRSGHRSRVGGRSLYWRGISLRIENEVLSEWPDSVSDVLQDSSGLYKELEDDLAVWSGVPSLSSFRTSEELELTSWLSRQGIDSTPTPRAVKPTGVNRWRAYSAIYDVPTGFVQSSVKVVGITVAPSSQILLQTEGTNSRYFVCNQLVLCAGVFENIRLARMVNDALTDSPLRVTDHIVSGLLVSQPHQQVPTLDSSLHLGFDQSTRSNTVYEVFPDGDGSIVDLWSMGEQPARAAFDCSFAGGSLTVSLSDTSKRIIADVYQRQGTHLADLARTLSMTIPPGLPKDHASATSLAKQTPGVAVPYCTSLGEHDHESGGLGLGGSIVDLDGRLRGRTDIYVAGPCIFPRAGAANPTLTSLALARRVARAVIA